MLTARRMRERMAQEAAGLPAPPPRRPDSIPTHEHDRIVLELNKAHAHELAELRSKRGKGPKPSPQRSADRIELENELVEKLKAVGAPELPLKILAAGLTALADGELLEAGEHLEDFTSYLESQGNRVAELQAELDKLREAQPPAEQPPTPPPAAPEPGPEQPPAEPPRGQRSRGR